MLQVNAETQLNTTLLHQISLSHNPRQVVSSIPPICVLPIFRNLKVSLTIEEQLSYLKKLKGVCAAKVRQHVGVNYLFRQALKLKDGEAAQQCLEFSANKEISTMVRRELCIAGCKDILSLICLDVDIPNEKGKTTLMQAVECGEIRTIMELLSAGAGIDKQDSKGWSALMYARESLKITKLLLAAGANPDLQNEGGETALVLAASRGKIECVKALLGAGASVNIPCYKGMTPLIHAAKNIDSCMMGLLLKTHADVNHVGKDGLTPLMHASMPNLDQLLIAGAEIDAQDNEGCTALMRAVYYMDFQKANFLIDYYADVNIRDRNGMSALMLLASLFNVTDSTETTFNKLMEAGANLYAEDGIGRTVFEHASRNREWEPLLQKNAPKRVRR